MNDIGILPGSIEEKLGLYMENSAGRVVLAQLFCGRLSAEMEPYFKALNSLFTDEPFEYGDHSSTKVLPLYEISCNPMMQWSDKNLLINLWNEEGVQKVKRNLLEQILVKFLEATTKAGYKISFAHKNKYVTPNEIKTIKPLRLSGNLHISTLSCLPVDDPGGIRDYYDDEGNLIYKSTRIIPKAPTIGHISFLEFGVNVEDKK